MYECTNPLHLGCPHCVWQSKMDLVANFYFPVTKLGNWKLLVINFWLSQFIIENFWSPIFSRHSQRLNVFGVPINILGATWKFESFDQNGHWSKTNFFCCYFKISIIAQIFQAMFKKSGDWFLVAQIFQAMFEKSGHWLILGCQPFGHHIGWLKIFGHPLWRFKVGDQILSR